MVVLGFAACDDDDPVDPGEVFTADMTVGAEVPPVQVVTGATRSARFELDDEDDETSYTLEVANITEIRCSC